MTWVMKRLSEGGGGTLPSLYCVPAVSSSNDLCNELQDHSGKIDLPGMRLLRRFNASSASLDPFRDGVGGFGASAFARRFIG